MIPVVIVAAVALAVGTRIGAHRTRRALQTTEGRQRHGFHRRTTDGYAAEFSGEFDDEFDDDLDLFTDPQPTTMEQALADHARHTGSPLTEVAAVPPTVALPRQDGTLPTPKPAVRLRVINGGPGTHQ